MSTADTPEPKRRRWLPELKSRWWSALLIASLALNLLIAAAVVTHFVRDGGRSEALSRPSYAQLIPRKFFSDLPRERRRELNDVLKKYRDDFRTGREDARANALKLADALDAEPFDATRATEAAAAFAASGNAMARRGSDLAVEFISKLTPDERKLLAQRIRDRSKPRKSN
ncbi:MAG: periplasmic heavy metal sensor [Aestuariivirga sp.]